MPISFYDSIKRHVEEVSIANVPIYRYMDMDGVIPTLQNQQLRLTRFDSSPNDPHEGKLSPGFISVLDEVNEGIAKDSGIPNFGADPIKQWAEITNREKCYFVSWSLNSPLETKMWDKYTKTSESCSFEMTPKKLKISIKDELDIASIGETFYQDSDDRSGSSIDHTRELFRKLPDHSEDHEVRLVLDIRWAPTKFDNPTGPDFPRYAYLNFDLSNVQRIYVKKYASEDTYFKVCALVKMYRLNIEIVLLT